MKTVKKLAVLLSLGALVPAAFAASPEQSYLESCRKEPGVPVPIAVVSPRVSSDAAGALVEIEFTVETSGQPSGLSVRSTTDSALAAVIVDAVKQWRFKPAERDGTPIATKVVLPVRIVEDALSGARLALK